MANFRTTRDRMLAAEARIKELEEENRDLQIQLNRALGEEFYSTKIYAEVAGGRGFPYKLRRSDGLSTVPLRGMSLAEAEAEAERWIQSRVQYCRPTTYELLDARGHIVAETTVYPKTIRLDGWSEAPFPLVAIG